MSQIRILHVVTIMDIGGIESMLMTMYRNIDRTQIQFDFLVFRKERGLFDDEIERLGGVIYRFPVLRMKSALSLSRHLTTFFRTHNYQIVHSHINTNSYFVLRSARIAKVPIRIAHAHTTQIAGTTYGKRLLKRIQRKNLIKVATHFFACGKEAGIWLFGKDRIEHLNILNNAIDTHLFRYSEEKQNSVRRELGFGSDDLVFIHTGSFSMAKNHSFLVDIFHYIKGKQPKAKLLLIGKGELRPSIEEKVNNLGLNGSISFLGVRPDVGSLLQAADCFLFPSLFEGLPVALIEAQCAGLPSFAFANITEEVFLTDFAFKIPENTSPEEFGDIVIEKINSLSIDRNSAYDSIVRGGYDIQESAKKLSEFYINIHEG